MPETRESLSAGYMPLDIIDTDRGVVRRAGGTGGNVAAILGFLGWHSRLAGRVGDDAAGHELLADLHRNGVDCDLIDVEPDAHTNRLIHEVRPTGHRYRYSCPVCERKLPRSRPLRLDEVDGVIAACPSPTVYFFDRANAATVALAEAYAATGTTLVVFEPSVPANAALVQRAMAAAAIVKGSHEHGPELVETYELCHPQQLRVITEGARGARFRLHDGAWHRVGVFPTRLVDAAGAGDWTTAGMLHALRNNSSPTIAAIREALGFGHALAALNCALPGARGLANHRTRQAVLALATRLRNGELVVPTLQEEPVAAAATDSLCSWCLQPSVGDTTAPRRSATG
jgi:fructokinase